MESLMILVLLIGEYAKPVSFQESRMMSNTTLLSYSSLLRGRLLGMRLQPGMSQEDVHQRLGMYSRARKGLSFSFENYTPIGISLVYCRGELREIEYEPWIPPGKLFWDLFTLQD